MSSTSVGHLITKTITTLQHFATLHYTYLHFTSIYTSLPSHLASPIYISYRSISPHITKLDTVHFSQLQMYFQNNEPLHCHKEPLAIDFTSLFIMYLFIFTYPINPSFHFALLFKSTTHFPSFHFRSLFTFYHPHFPSLLFTFLNLVLKLRVLPWEQPITPSVTFFQSVMELFTKEYFPMSVLRFLALIFQ
jgi:hypothetical protein